MTSGWMITIVIIIDAEDGHSPQPTVPRYWSVPTSATPSAMVQRDSRRWIHIALIVVVQCPPVLDTAPSSSPVDGPGTSWLGDDSQSSDALAATMAGWLEAHGQASLFGSWHY